MKIEIISRETIKPSSPTPLHLKTYKLSILDQICPSFYVPLYLFYTTSSNFANKSQILKTSLSQTLAHFYPFAGKIKDDYFIDCNDEGVLFVEAKVTSKLSKFLGQQDNELMKKLLPDVPNDETEMGGGYVAMIQINEFECGGIAITTYTSHKLFDGVTVNTFLKAWATVATCGPSATICTSFIAPTLFPHNPTLPKSLCKDMWTKQIKLGRSVTKRFVFDTSSISRFKSSIAQQTSLTRFEVVTSLIWKCTIEASTQLNNKTKRASVLFSAVDLRKRITPSVTSNNNMIGNIFWITPAICDVNSNIELNCLLGLMRKAISKINQEFARGIEGEKGYSMICEALEETEEAHLKKETDFLMCTSTIGMGFYEIDFGWGKPMWTSFSNPGDSFYTNRLIMNETRCGCGVETWVTLGDSHMAVFENNPELLAFASVDPTPLPLSNL